MDEMAHADESVTEKADREKWESEEDVRTLVRAGEIRKDKARLKRATVMATEQLQALEEIK